MTLYIFFPQSSCFLLSVPAGRWTDWESSHHRTRTYSLPVPSKKYCLKCSTSNIQWFQSESQVGKPEFHLPHPCTLGGTFHQWISTTEWNGKWEVRKQALASISILPCFLNTQYGRWPQIATETEAPSFSSSSLFNLAFFYYPFLWKLTWKQNGFQFYLGLSLLLWAWLEGQRACALRGGVCACMRVRTM